jgi:hypothetical protein
MDMGSQRGFAGFQQFPQDILSFLWGGLHYVIPFIFDSCRVLFFCRTVYSLAPVVGAIHESPLRLPRTFSFQGKEI